MTLHLKNVQKLALFNMRHFEKDVIQLRTAAGVQKYDLGIMCTDTNHVNRLKQDLKKKSSAKEILVFPYNEQSKYWSPSGTQPVHHVQYNLGDIILDIPAIALRGKQDCINLQSIMTVMTSRGLVQLMGYENEKDMYEHQLDILNKYNSLTGAHLEPLEGHQKYFPQPHSVDLESLEFPNHEHISPPKQQAVA